MRNHNCCRNNIVDGALRSFGMLSVMLVFSTYKCSLIHHIIVHNNNWIIHSVCGSEKKRESNHVTTHHVLIESPSYSSQKPNSQFNTKTCEIATWSVYVHKVIKETRLLNSAYHMMWIHLVLIGIFVVWKIPNLNSK